jgi:hypothetical protein
LEINQIGNESGNENGNESLTTNLSAVHISGPDFENSSQLDSVTLNRSQNVFSCSKHTPTPVSSPIYKDDIASRAY